MRVFVVCSMHHGRASPNTALIVKMVGLILVSRVRIS